MVDYVREGLGWSGEQNCTAYSDEELGRQGGQSKNARGGCLRCSRDA